MKYEPLILLAEDDPNDEDLIRLALEESNLEYSLDVVRDGKNFKGYLLGFLLGFAGRWVLGGAFAKTVKAIEARNGQEVKARAATA